MTAYATLTYYKNTYLGVVIADADFPRMALRASAVIDSITYNRAAAVITDNDPAASVTAIQKACCAIAEELQTQEQSGNIDGITSESTGAHSVSYGTSSKAQLTNEEKQANVAKLYLAGTGLMFRGLIEGE